jgi:LPPG:FO 2-phospho-L-lactate transferase
VSGGRVVAFSGGVGGAKLALGLARVLEPESLLVIANTGDDFSHLGLAISPDLDTLLYVLAGIDNLTTGWGRRGETWSFMAALGALGGETWFRLGDGDLAAHVERTRRLQAGETLSAITDDFRRRLGIAAKIVPMSDDPVRTRLETSEGWLDFQHYFVRRRCEPAVRAIEFAGAEAARPQPEILAALADPGLRAVILCPSNPLISIEPILAVPGVRPALAQCTAPVIAVTPIISGRAVKGPTTKMMQELGIAPEALSVARRYADFIDAFVIDRADQAGADMPGVKLVPADTLMLTVTDREALARTVLAAADAMRDKAR